MIAIPFILNTLASFVVGLLVAKFLGPAEYGRYAIALSAGIVIQTLAFDWLRLSATRFTAPDATGAARVAASLNVLTLGLGGLACVAAVAAYFAPLPFAVDPALSMLAVLIALANGLYDFAGAMLRARFCNGAYRGLVLVRALLSGLLIVAAAAWFHSAAVALGGVVAAMIGAVAFANKDVFDRGAGAGLATRGQVRAFAGYALPIVLANVLIQGAPFLNRSLASQAYGLAEAGQLALAFDIGLRLIAAAGSTIDALVFQLAVRAEAEHGAEAARKQVAANIAMVFAVVAPIVVGCLLAMPSFEALLIPEAFRGPFAHYFLWLSPAFLAFALTMYCVVPIFQIVHRTAPLIFGGAVTLAVNALMIFALPRGADATGFALAQSVASAAGFAAVAALAVWLAPTRPSFRDLFGVIGACGAMALAVWPLRGLAPGVLALAAQGAVGAAVYGGVIWGLDVCGVRGLVRLRQVAEAGGQERAARPSVDLAA